MEWDIEKSGAILHVKCSSYSGDRKEISVGSKALPTMPRVKQQLYLTTFSIALLLIFSRTLGRVVVGISRINL